MMKLKNNIASYVIRADYNKGTLFWRFHLLVAKRSILLLNSTCDTAATSRKHWAGTVTQHFWWDIYDA